jgi:hypothetical protein
MVPQVGEPREYEHYSHHSTNSPSQPLGHGLLVWPGPTHEGRIKFTRSETDYNGRNSHEYLKNPSCQELLPPFLVRALLLASINYTTSWLSFVPVSPEFWSQCLSSLLVRRGATPAQHRLPATPLLATTDSKESASKRR